jgi:RNA 3'-terminal phosphate cyclase-like protein
LVLNLAGAQTLFPGALANVNPFLEEMTNGTTIKVNETGTILFYSPGMLTGGVIEHECRTERAAGYLLEVLLALGPFCAEPLMVRELFLGIPYCF